MRLDKKSIKIKRIGSFETEEFVCECNESILNNKRVITFEDRQEETTTKHILKILEKDDIEWSRLGKISSKTHFKKGEKTSLILKMSEGKMHLFILTDDIKIKEKEITIKYTIYQANQKIDDCFVSMSII